MNKIAIAKYIGFSGMKVGLLSALGGTILTTAGIYVVNRLILDDLKNPPSRLDDLKDAAEAGLDVGKYIISFSLALTAATVAVGIMVPSLISDEARKEIEADEARSMEKEDAMNLYIFQQIFLDPGTPIPMDSIPTRKHESIRRLSAEGKLKIQMMDGVEVVTMPSKDDKEDKDELVEKMLNIHARTILEDIRMRSHLPPIILEDQPPADQEVIHHLVRARLLVLIPKDGQHLVRAQQNKVKVPTSTSN